MDRWSKTEVVCVNWDKETVTNGTGGLLGASFGIVYQQSR